MVSPILYLRRSGSTLIWCFFFRSYQTCSPALVLTSPVHPTPGLFRRRQANDGGESDDASGASSVSDTPSELLDEDDPYGDDEDVRKNKSSTGEAEGGGWGGGLKGVRGQWHVQTEHARGARSTKL